eukprot:12913784-Prorocentrum_lima.AAC.1
MMPKQLYWTSFPHLVLEGAVADWVAFAAEVGVDMVLALPQLVDGVALPAHLLNKFLGGLLRGGMESTFAGLVALGL